MKNILKKIKNIFKKEKDQSPYTINPHKHWVTLLCVFFAIILLLILFSIYLMFQIKRDQIFQVTPVVQENNSLINDKILRKVTESFDQKAQKEQELIKNPPSYRDPSL